MVKRRNGKPNRKNSARNRSTAPRIATGIPVSKRRESPDPPMLPVVLAYPTRIRFNVYHQHSNALTGYTVILASLPTSFNSIIFYYNAVTGTKPAAAFGLTSDQICHAAAMRVYGVDVSADTLGANYITTEYAIQKIVAYGTENRMLTTSGITLAADFGPDIPGFVGKDTGAANRRAVVAVTPPRLSWITFNGSANHLLSMNAGDINPHFEPNAPSSSLSLLMAVATLDISIIVRRGAVTQAPASATAVIRSDDFHAKAMNSE